jgi:hypothetical protein
MADHSNLQALLLRLKQYHPRHQAELFTLEHLLQEYCITDEVFGQALKKGHGQVNAHLPLH